MTVDIRKKEGIFFSFFHFLNGCIYLPMYKVFERYLKNHLLHFITV